MLNILDLPTIIALILLFLLTFIIYSFSISWVSDEASPSFIRLILISLLFTWYWYAQILSMWPYPEIPFYIDIILIIVTFFLLWVGFLDYVYISIIVSIWIFTFISVLDEVITLLDKVVSFFSGIFL